MSMFIKTFCVVLFVFFQNANLFCSVNDVVKEVQNQNKLNDTIKPSSQKLTRIFDLSNNGTNVFYDINKGLNHDIVQNAFKRLEEGNYIPRNFLDSLIRLEPKKNSSEGTKYLSNVKYLLNPDIEMDERCEYFFNLSISNEFYAYSDYLKFSTHFHLYLIFTQKEEHILALKELLMSIKYLENTKVVESNDLAYFYNLIAYTAFNYSGDSEISKKAYLAALKIYEDNNQYDLQVKAIYNLSLMAYENKQYIESINYCEKAIELFDVHIPKHNILNWTGIYPTYLLSLSRTSKPTGKILSVFGEAQGLLESNKLSENIYNGFVVNSLEAFVLCNMDDEYNKHINRLLEMYSATEENRFARSQIYSAIAMYQNSHNDHNERETHIKRLEISYEQYETNYYKMECESALNRLIEIDEKNNNNDQLLIWYKKKLELNIFNENKNNAHSIQVDYWSEKDLNYAEREIVFHKEKLRYSRSLIMEVSIFSIILLIVLYKIWSLLKTSKRQEQELSISHDQLDQKNQELLNANTLIKDMNLELEADLKNLLLLTSSNKKFFKKLIENIDEHISDLGAKNLLKSIIRKNQEDNIFEEIDHKFLLLNESFFSALSRSFPKLTNNELKLCALIKMNLSTKEIARIQYQTPGTAKVAKSRLRKKLNLTGTDVNIVSFLNTIS